MSEPVGNTPRNTDFPGNSLKGRDAGAQQQSKAAPPLPEEREKLQKIVTGKATLRKTPWWKRAVGSVVAEDASSVGEYLVNNVFIPTIRNVIRTAVVETTDQVLFGNARNPRVGVGTTVGAALGRTVISGSSLRTQYATAPVEQSRRVLGQEAMARHDFTDVIVADRQEAIEVVQAMLAQLQEYQSVTVSDLYDLLGVSGSFADRKWGWYNLDTADIHQVHGGYKLDLPRPTPLR